MTDHKVQLLPSGEKVIYKTIAVPQVTPSTSSVCQSEDNAMTPIYINIIDNKGQETRQFHLYEKLKKVITPSQNSQDPATYESIFNIFLAASNEENQRVQTSRRSRCVEWWNSVQTEHTRALCFWRILCVILTAGIMIIIIMLRKPVVNEYHTYE